MQSAILFYGFRPSVRPSRYGIAFYLNEGTRRQTFPTIWQEHQSSFQPFCRYKIPKEPLRAGWENSAMFDRNCQRRRN